MKTTMTRATRGFLLLAAVTIFSLVGVTKSMAHDHDAWSHDDRGYWDDHRAYHHFIYYQNHRGYWRENNGVRIWITI